jgi:hypothetical protein
MIAKMQTKNCQSPTNKRNGEAQIKNMIFNGDKILKSIANNSENNINRCSSYAYKKTMSLY